MTDSGIARRTGKSFKYVTTATESQRILGINIRNKISLVEYIAMYALKLQKLPAFSLFFLLPSIPSCPDCIPGKCQGRGEDILRGNKGL